MRKFNFFEYSVLLGAGEFRPVLGRQIDDPLLARRCAVGPLRVGIPVDSLLVKVGVQIVAEALFFFDPCSRFPVIKFANFVILDINSFSTYDAA